MPPQWRGSPHQSAKVSSLCLRAKDHLEGTRVAVFLRFCAHEKTSPATQRAGGHRRVAREDDGRPGYPRGAGVPEPADGGIRTECTRRGHLSRRSLSFSRNLRAGELSEALPPAQPSRFTLSARHDWRHLDATFLSATRRLVCEARKESSCCKDFDGSQNIQSFRDRQSDCEAPDCSSL